MKKLSSVFGVILAVHAVSAKAGGKSEVLVLSGGGNPASNHFSQYLQTKTLANGMRSQLGNTHVSVMFGAGNNPAKSSILADVHRNIVLNSRPYPDMLFGTIEGNRAATMANVESWFSSHNFSSDTFFLFVSDHGMPNKESDGDTYDDNCIDLWSYDPKEMTTLSSDQQCLSQSKLKGILQDRVRTKNTVFVMSQCYSGGFHQMSVSMEKGYPHALPNICGFTSVTADETASGCTPDVDGPGYKGYERFFTQQITGLDVVTGKAMPYARKEKVKHAHYSAAIEDTTKDIPLTTSDYYLNAWAKIMTKDGFKARGDAGNFNKAGTIFNDATNNRLGDEALAQFAGPLADMTREKVAHLRAQEKMLSKLHPDFQKVIVRGSAQELYDAGQKVMEDVDQKEQKLNEAMDRMAELYSETIKPAWNDSLETPQSPLKGTLLKFEQEALQTDDTETVCAWHLAGLKTRGDSANYKAVQIFCGDRLTLMQRAATKAGKQQAVAEYTRLAPQVEKLRKEVDDLTLVKHHIRRLLILRSVVAAVVALAQLNDEIAINELLALQACENATF